ncbi:outer membrane protein [Peteryoungia ipomoeae]|uniref:Porin family protein n=1 Tax=Peteryoungia ipomoeae TaxID=1210932 RepID=A0A4S8NYY0_9HYPH|nr:outer membrane protein [Peteryoungia ipomoeae]THV21592.1 porin family protein [Peteryoungia ipomoeae]
MIKTVLLASIAAIAISTTTLAADADFAAPEAPLAPVEETPGFSWAGGYAGAHTGYGFGDASIDRFGSASVDGARLGGFAGYNWQFSNGFVVGLEGDLNYDWNDGKLAGVNVEGGLNGSGRIRAGYAFDRALIFAAGGVAATEFKAFDPCFSDEGTAIGWTVGGGVDFAVTDRIFTRLEYRYNDFGSTKVAGADVDFNQHVVNVGFGVKF